MRDYYHDKDQDPLLIGAAWTLALLLVCYLIGLLVFAYLRALGLVSSA